MANAKTAAWTLGIFTREQKALLDLQLPDDLAFFGSVAFDPKGNIVLRRNRKPTVLEETYRRLPKYVRRKFVLLTKKPTPAPSKSERETFERALLKTIRRIIGERIEKRLRKIPNPTGAPTLKRERIEWVYKTVREFERDRRKYPTRRAAVKATAEYLQSQNERMTERTVWRYLRLSKGRIPYRPRPRVTPQ